MSMHIMQPQMTPSEPVLNQDRPHMLIVGNILQWGLQGRILPANENCWFIDFDALSAGTITRLKPQIILSPLVGDGFDAIGVVRKLSQLFYTGPYRAISGDLPNPVAVSQEVSASAPSVNFDLVILPSKQGSNRA